MFGARWSSNNTPTRIVICLPCLVQVRTSQSILLKLRKRSMTRPEPTPPNDDLTLSVDRLGCLRVQVSRSYSCSRLPSNSRSINDATGNMLY
ncbi:hypothetical protein AUEXF2481DRAFT_642062 [Aureobasidium subglaciale EXF-2481]|uniref:Uncharacterized protein n=1 Tax=Aureobasidium subglaciale (strain EXF-2481) TaxID=1043005 RepID=A0A074YKB5_AURSE|nr:uncharacterized protein AUEXF2481DRAFT_642062 [Aureobasidium subglaciale EXF-2481]KEQ96514.1 hypothetical protein AUEXF2481DRAFT_642062 [Aureobasidium subglaciale EXF-2481]